MKNYLRIEYFAFLFIVSGCSKEVTIPLETTIINLAKDRSQAVVKYDTSFLLQILDENFVYINTSGKTLNRESYLEGLVSFKNDSSYWISQDLDRIGVKSMNNGDAAIITFRVHDKFMYEGILYTNYCSSTFVYERKGKEWKCLLGQTTKIESDQ